MTASAKEGDERRGGETGLDSAPSLVDEIHLGVLERMIVVPRILLGAVLSGQKEG